MKLEKAIEIKRALSFRNGHLMTKEETLADDLSIEAMKRVQSQRMPNASVIFHPLPGETED